MLLIFPPVAKPCEPPAGLARLAGALAQHGVPFSLLDANFEGLMTALSSPVAQAVDRWSSRAARGLGQNLYNLSSPNGYAHFDRYKRAVADLNRLVEVHAASSGVRLSLGDYQDPCFSPVRSADLLAAAEAPERNVFYRYFSERLEGLLVSLRPCVVGFSLNYLSQALCTFAMAGFLRRRCGHLRIILGGGLVTSWLRQPGFRNPFGGLIDSLVAGPGEAHLLAMAGAEADNGAFRPDFKDFSRNRYLSPGFVLPYSASSGCYWSRCSFCPERAEGNPYRPVPRTRVREDIQALGRATQPVLLHLLDNAVCPAVLTDLAREGPAMPWYGFARVSGLLTDPDFCRGLRASGCVMLKLGLESGDQDVLDAMGKGVRLADASRVLQNLKAAGIATYVYLLFGTPAETRAEAMRTLQFTVRHADAIGFLNLAVFNLPIHSPDSARLRTGSFYEGDLSLYAPFAHPKGWDRPLVRRFVEREFRRHPAVAAILRRDPPIFTSNHAAFFTDGWREFRPRFF